MVMTLGLIPCCDPCRYCVPIHSLYLFMLEAEPQPIPYIPLLPLFSGHGGDRGDNHALGRFQGLVVFTFPWPSFIPHYLYSPSFDPSAPVFYSHSESHPQTTIYCALYFIIYCVPCHFWVCIVFDSTSLSRPIFTFCYIVFIPSLLFIHLIVIYTVPTFISLFQFYHIHSSPLTQVVEWLNNVSRSFTICPLCWP